MGTLKIMFAAILAIMQLEYFCLVSARPTLTADEISMKPTNTDYYALQALVGQKLTATSEERAQVVELLVQLLSEIDLPTLCEVIANETKATQKKDAQFPLKSQTNDGSLPTEENSELIIYLRENSTVTNSNLSSSENTATFLARETQVNDTRTAVSYTSKNSQNTERIPASTTTERHVSASYKNYKNYLNNIEQDLSDLEKPIIMDDLDEAKYSELLSLPLDNFADVNIVSGEGGSLGGKLWQPLPKDSELLYSSLGKQAELIKKLNMNPAQLIDKTKLLHSSILNQLQAGQSTNITDAKQNGVSQKTAGEISVGPQKPRSQLYANSLVLGDWLEDSNPYFVDREGGQKSKLQREQRIRVPDYVNEYAEGRASSTSDNKNKNNFENLVDYKNWSMDKLKGKGEFDIAEDITQQGDLKLKTYDNKGGKDLMKDTNTTLITQSFREKSDSNVASGKNEEDTDGSESSHHFSEVFKQSKDQNINIKNRIPKKQETDSMKLEEKINKKFVKGNFRAIGHLNKRRKFPSNKIKTQGITFRNESNLLQHMVTTEASISQPSQSVITPDIRRLQSISLGNLTDNTAALENIQTDITEQLSKLLGTFGDRLEQHEKYAIEVDNNQSLENFTTSNETVNSQDQNTLSDDNDKSKLRTANHRDDQVPGTSATTTKNYSKENTTPASDKDYVPGGETRKHANDTFGNTEKPQRTTKDSSAQDITKENNFTDKGISNLIVPELDSDKKLSIDTRTVDNTADYLLTETLNIWNVPPSTVSVTSEESLTNNITSKSSKKWSTDEISALPSTSSPSNGKYVDLFVQDGDYSKEDYLNGSYKTLNITGAEALQEYSNTSSATDDRAVSNVTFFVQQPADIWEHPTNHENFVYDAKLDTYNIKMAEPDNDGATINKSKEHKEDNSDIASEILSRGGTNVSDKMIIHNFSQNINVNLTDLQASFKFTDLRVNSNFTDLQTNDSLAETEKLSIITSDVYNPLEPTDLLDMNSRGLVSGSVSRFRSKDLPVGSTALDSSNRDSSSSRVVKSKFLTTQSSKESSFDADTHASTKPNDSLMVAEMTKAQFLDLSPKTKIDKVTPRVKHESSLFSGIVDQTTTSGTSGESDREELNHSESLFQKSGNINGYKDKIQLNSISASAAGTKITADTNNLFSRIPTEISQRNKNSDNFSLSGFADQSSETHEGSLLATNSIQRPMNTTPVQDHAASGKDGSPAGVHSHYKSIRLQADVSVQVTETLNENDRTSEMAAEEENSSVGDTTTKPGFHDDGIDNKTLTKASTSSSITLLEDTTSQIKSRDNITMDRLKSISFMVAGTKANLSEVNFNFIDKIKRKPRYEFETKDSGSNTYADSSSLEEKIWLEEIRHSTPAPKTTNKKSMFNISNEDKEQGVITFDGQITKSNTSNILISSFDDWSLTVDQDSLHHKTAIPTETVEMASMTKNQRPVFHINDLSPIAEERSSSELELSTFSVLSPSSNAEQTTTQSIIISYNKSDETSTISMLDESEKTERSTLSTLEIPKQTDEMSDLSSLDVLANNDETSTLISLDVSNKTDQTPTTSVVDMSNISADISTSNSLDMPEAPKWSPNPYALYVSNTPSGTVSPRIQIIVSKSNVTSDLIKDFSDKILENSPENSESFNEHSSTDPEIYVHNVDGDSNADNIVTLSDTKDTNKESVHQYGLMGIDQEDYSGKKSFTMRPVVDPDELDWPDWPGQDNSQTVPNPSMHPWKAYNIVLGELKAKQHSSNLAQRDDSASHLFPDTEPAPILSENNVKTYLWKARPWPGNTVYKQTLNFVDEQTDTKYSDRDENKTKDINNPLNYQMKLLNALQKLKNYEDNSKYSNHISFGQELGQRVHDQDVFASKFRDPTKWDSFYQPDKANNDNAAETSLESINYVNSRTPTMVHKTEYKDRITLPTSIVEENTNFDYSDIVNNKFRQAENTNDRRKVPFNRQNIVYNRLHQNRLHNDLHESEANPEMSAELVPLSDESFTSAKGVPVPSEYTCPDWFGHHRDPNNCQAFFICSWGMPHRVVCPPGTLYNPTEAVCDWAVNVKCFNTEDKSPHHSN